MANRNVRNVTTGALIAIVVGALAIAFLKPNTEVTAQSGEVTGIDQATVEDALVTSITEQGGFRFLGITFSSATYRAQVSFTAPPDCLEVISNVTDWPAGRPACEPNGNFTGEISGSGRTATGETIVSVRFEVTEDCYKVIAIGDAWGTHRECRES